MNKEEALKQIESITQMIKLSNRVFFSGARMIAYGCLVISIPLIELATKNLTFGINFTKGAWAGLVITLLHVIFYYSLFAVAGKLVVTKYADEDEVDSIHPLIKQAFSLYKPIVASIIGTTFVFIMIKQECLVFPVVFLFLGILFNLLGSFSIKAVKFISWSYIVVGLGYAFLTQYKIPYLWTYFTTYLGLTYIFMGYLLKKGRSS